MNTILKVLTLGAALATSSCAVPYLAFAPLLALNTSPNDSPYNQPPDAVRMRQQRDELRQKQTVERQKKIDEQKIIDAKQEKEHQRIAPHCNPVEVNGYGATSPTLLFQLYKSENPEKILPNHRLRCNSMFTYCDGYAMLLGQDATVLTWDKDYILVSAELDFVDSGNQRIGLFIRHKDASCPNNEISKKTASSNVVQKAKPANPVNKQSISREHKGLSLGMTLDSTKEIVPLYGCKLHEDGITGCWIGNENNRYDTGSVSFKANSLVSFLFVYHGQNDFNSLIQDNTQRYGPPQESKGDLSIIGKLTSFKWNDSRTELSLTRQQGMDTNGDPFDMTLFQLKEININSPGE